MSDSDIIYKITSRGERIVSDPKIWAKINPDVLKIVNEEIEKIRGGE